MPQSASLGVLLDHTQDKIVILDDDGRYTYANAAVERILGYTPDEIVGLNAFEQIHPDDVDEARSAFERTISSEMYTETTVDLRYESKDGSWVWLESRMSNVTDEQLDGYVVSSRHVSDRIEAQRERREIATRLEQLAATTGDVLWMFNADWSELLFVNPAYEQVMGQPVDELHQDPAAFLDAIHPDDIPAVEDAMECLSAGNPVELEYRVNPETDYGIWVWVQGQPIVEDGEVVRISGFSRDISNRRRRERQLYVMDHLLRHNIRNDLSVILGQAELIEDETPSQADKTAVIRRTGQALLTSAEKQRDIIDVLTDTVARESFDLVTVVIEGVETVRERFPGARIDLSLPTEASACVLDEIRFAVVELMENAIIHSETDQPSVDVSLQCVDDHVALTIEDDASEISEMEATVLTGDHEMTSVYHSTGLGFWLVYWVVELSEGSVSVESVSTGGNRIQLTLPQR